MDYFKYIHSGDVREHLRRINYPLSSLEAAWLVWENDIAPIKEKHAAWEEIIRTMPDCMIEERYQIRKQDSLHDYLKRLMRLQRAREDAFCLNEKAVYVYSWHTRGMDGCTMSEPLGYFGKSGENFLPHQSGNRAERCLFIHATVENSKECNNGINAGAKNTPIRCRW